MHLRLVPAALLLWNSAAGSPVKWEDWKHRTRDMDPDAAIVKGLVEAEPVSALAPAPLEAAKEEKLTKLEQWEATGEEKALGDVLRSETGDPERGRFGRWGGDAGRWLGREAKLARSDLAFGVVAHAASTVHLGLLKHW